jgi:hypothetical protein
MGATTFAKGPARAAISLGEALALVALVIARVSPAAAAEPAPAQAESLSAPPAPDTAPAEPGVRPLRLGVLGGVGFPRPLSVEALAQLYGIVTVGLEYGALPPLTIDSVRASLWSVAGDVRVSPFRGSMSSFFVGTRFGRQHVGAETPVTVPMLGTANEVLGLDSWFLNPRVGFLWTWPGGEGRQGDVVQPALAIGIEAGVQIPLGPTVSSTLPLSLAPDANRAASTLGKTVLPTVDLLRLGLML